MILIVNILCPIVFVIDSEWPKVFPLFLLNVKIGCFLRLLSVGNDFHFISVDNQKDSAFCSLIIIPAHLIFTICNLYYTSHCKFAIICFIFSRQRNENEDVILNEFTTYLPSYFCYQNYFYSQYNTGISYLC